MKTKQGNENLKIPKRLIKCPKCGYIWEPVVAKPKSCPECKVRLGWYTRKK